MVFYICLMNGWMNEWIYEGINENSEVEVSVIWR